MKGSLGLVRGAWRWIDDFSLAPGAAAPLAALRIGLAAVLLAQAALLASTLLQFYGSSGLLSPALRHALPGSALPGLDQLAGLAPNRVGVAPLAVGTGVVYVLSLGALLLGWRTRAAAALAWLTHLTLRNTAVSISYGADDFANIFLFYLVWLPSGAAFSLDRRSGRASGEPSTAARLGLRVVQLHLCVSYLRGGLAKARGPDWWNGESVWRALMLPEYRQLDVSWLASHRWMVMIAGWMVLLIEIGYAALIWPRRTRRIWLLATVAMHLGIAIGMGLGVFAAVMIVANLAAFGVTTTACTRQVRGRQELHDVCRCERSRLDGEAQRASMPEGRRQRSR